MAFVGSGPGRPVLRGRPRIYAKGADFEEAPRPLQAALPLGPDGAGAVALREGRRREAGQPPALSYLSKAVRSFFKRG